MRSHFSPPVFARECCLIIDLHMHSTASDGVMTPERLVNFVNKERRVNVMALTDHDTVGGVCAAERAAAGLGVRFIPGIEISSMWGSTCIHIVGLGVDVHNAELLETTAAQCAKRDSRAVEMGRRLEELGFPGMFEAACAKSHTAMNISRLHFALSLVEIGAVKNVQAAFDKYLGKDRPAYVAAAWGSVADAVELIHRAGGAAVLAHPGRYHFKNDWELDSLVEGFATAGGEGIEVVSGSQNPSFTPRCLAWAAEYNFYCSTGSDFHSRDGMRPEPGAQGQLPKGVHSILDIVG